MITRFERVLEARKGVGCLKYAKEINKYIFLYKTPLEASMSLSQERQVMNRANSFPYFVTNLALDSSCLLAKKRHAVF